MQSLAVLLAVAALAGSAPAEDLPRRPALGVGAAAASEGGGLVVRIVTPGLTGDRLGVRQGDRLLTLNGERLAAPSDLARAVRNLEPAAAVNLTLERAGRPVRLAGRAEPRPLESHPGARVIYSETPFRGGRLREILALPSDGAGAPVVFLIPGYTCSTVEPLDPEHPYRRLVSDLLAAGVGVYRVEKPGVGDSRGGPDCQTSDFETELAAFQAGYDSLVATHGVSPSRVFLLGHSMGGIEAPLLAAKRPPRGVIVYGTVFRNWADYHLDLVKHQGFQLANTDPVDDNRRAETLRGSLRAFYESPQPPAAMAPGDAALRDFLEKDFGWDGKDQLLGRSSAFWRALPKLDLTAAWRDSQSHVLSLYGEADLEALNDADHRLVAAVVNHYRPGTAEFRTMLGDDHLMNRVGDREAVAAAVRTTGRPPQGRYDPAISSAMSDWIKAVMTKPPVPER